MRPRNEHKRSPCCMVRRGRECARSSKVRQKRAFLLFPERMEKQRRVEKYAFELVFCDCLFCEFPEKSGVKLIGKLIPYPIFRDLNYPSDLAVLKTNTVILANVLDEILEKRLVFQPTNNSTLKHESRQNGDFRHVISGAGDENRTRVRCLGSIGNNHYTTPALANHYNSAAVHPTGQFNETPRVSA